MSRHAELRVAVDEAFSGGDLTLRGRQSLRAAFLSTFSDLDSKDVETLFGGYLDCITGEEALQQRIAAEWADVAVQRSRMEELGWTEGRIETALGIRSDQIAALSRREFLAERTLHAQFAQFVQESFNDKKTAGQILRLTDPSEGALAEPKPEPGQ